MMGARRVSDAGHGMLWTSLVEMAFNAMSGNRYDGVPPDRMAFSQSRRLCSRLADHPRPHVASSPSVSVVLRTPLVP